ncbi:PIR Superfamily Protein [Plasmodium ovale curtisi]|uniref:PIR Superfamily Protein n=1 Tax=Plasmodium ovale curtisi TaxID=864141 RepID=A0A1A8X5R7_PLAOA|nr:PIR Superfamily Protein [Plasmodium ovale curtisi]
MAYRVDILKSQLPSIQHDIYWNNPVISCEKCSLCDNVNRNKKDMPWFKFLCYQLVKNLELSEDLNSRNNQDERESRCKSLMYWMYDKVKTFYEKSSVKNNDKLIPELLGVWKNFFDNNPGTGKFYKCKVPEASEFKDIKDVKKRKTMFDYCWNYSELSRILKRYVSYENCHIYYDYFKDGLRKYKETVTECNAQDFIINGCSSFSSNADPDDVLNTPKCRSIEISPEKDGYVKKDACDAFKKPDPEVIYRTEEIPVPEFTFSDNRAIILIFLSLWGVFLTFLFLYKMTPFRSWISNKLGKRKIIRDNFNEKSDDETLNADYESMDINMENIGYNVTYNTDWNSSR